MTDAPRDDKLTGDVTDDMPDTYVTDSGVVADINDVEVDVVPSGEGAIVSSQADPEAYGVEVDDNVEIPNLPPNEA